MTACEMLAARATGFSLGAGHVGTFCLELTDIPDSQEASSSAGQSGHREPLLLGNARALLGFRLAYASHGPHWGPDSRFGLSVNDSFCSNREKAGRLWGRNLFENKEEQVSKAQHLLDSEQKPVLISGKFEDDDAHFACR